MKNFACLILGMGLLVNATMANLNENDVVDRVKRGSLNFKVSRELNISATKKNFIGTQIKKLYRDIIDGPNRGKMALALSNAMKNKFRGRWMVLICEHREICGFHNGGLKIHEFVIGWYGRVFLEVARF